ncbi:MAG TPA: carbohydrate-binding protein, partial [Prolixibacteraceae bacterium]|nr:carbohydrate-binding protein [Prolixibacteraceae bacterium]
GLLNQVHYDANLKPVADYPVNKSFTAPKLPSSGIPWMVPKSDFFAAPSLHPEWSFLGYTASNKFSLSERPGWLRLTPKSATKANTVIKNDGEHNYSLITRLDFKAKSATDEAGLRIIRGDETKFVKLYSSLAGDGKKRIAFSFENTLKEVENTVGDTLWLKMVRINHKISGYYSSNGNNWTQIGTAVDISIIDSYSDFSSWAGTRQGLYVQGTTSAWFDCYIYRDAYTPIMAESPANQYGTTKNAPLQGVSSLDEIHPNDWALYAGVEFGNSDYQIIPDSVEFTVSSIAVGGSVQVWLDSIDTGIKIAECAIGNTGSWTAFKKYKAPVTAVSGNHDVYLKFTGSGTGKLFQLRWISFTKKSTVVNSASTLRKEGNVSLFPNPAKDRLTVSSGFKFNKVEIFKMNGAMVYQNEKKAVTSAMLNLALENGVYVLRISSDQYIASSKFTVKL